MITERSQLKEKTRHGKPDFPVAVYASHRNHHEDILFTHWHEESEVLLLTSGSAEFRLDDRTISLKAGDALLVAGGTLHGGFSREYADCSFFAIVYHPYLLSGLPGQTDIQHLVKPLIEGKLQFPDFLLQSDEQNAHLLRQIRKSAEQWLCEADGRELRILSLLTGLLGELAERGAMYYTAGGENYGNDVNMTRIKQCVQYIQEHAHLPLSVDDMARSIHLSRYHFCRFFKEMTDSTPQAYLTNYRLQMAEPLLHDSERRIMDIALASGFDSVNWFNVCFKRRYGCTPSEYRKMSETIYACNSTPIML